MNKKLRKLTGAMMIASIMGGAAVLPQNILPFNMVNASAESATSAFIDGVKYEFNTDDFTASIVGLDNSVTSLTTPETITFEDVTYTVNSIGDYSCAKKTNLENLTISENIEYVGRFSFGNCYSLESVTINGTPDFELWTFFSCNHLKDVDLDDNITALSEAMFEGCEALETIDLPSNLETIGNRAFLNCLSLTSISIPESVQVIPGAAFLGCTSLTSISIPDSVHTISSEAFDSCTSMTYIDLPDNLTNIGFRAFRNCTSLEMPEFPITLESIGNQAFENTPSITGTLVISENVTNIGDHCFSESGISEVYSNSSATIDFSAFYNNTNLVKVTLTGNEKLNGAFWSCKNLSNIIVPLSANYNWNDSAFDNCPNLQYINDEKIEFSYDEDINDVVFTNSAAMDEFIRTHFNASSGVGFIESYVDYYCDEVVQRFITPDMTDIQKAKALHDWIINKVEYDHNDMYADKNHCDCSVFINDTTVCDGYARGYARLMNKAGIETEYFTNMTHAWNKCKFGDIYLNVDTCWDDPHNSYPWFLLSDKEVLEHDADSHCYVDGMPYSNYPMGDLNMDTVVGVDDYRIMQKYLSGNIDLNYNQSILADLNFDGELDNADLRLMKEKCQKRFDLNGDRKLNNNDHALLQFAIVNQLDLSKEDNYKFDINNDGVIDYKDAKEMRAFLEKYCNQDKNAYYRMGDLNLDGTVDREDYNALKDYINNKTEFKADHRLADLVFNNFTIVEEDLELLDELTKYEIGDVNLDNQIDINDKNLLMDYIAGNADISYKVLWYADINGDGAIDNKDVDKLGRMLG